MDLLNSLGSLFNSFRTTKELASAPANQPTKKRPLNYNYKAVSRTRQDIKNWNDGLNLANSDEPKNFQLQLLFNEVAIDALFTSQVENRTQSVLSSEFSLKTTAGEVDKEQTLFLKNNLFRSFTKVLLDSNYYGYNVIQLDLVKDSTGKFTVDINVVPRTNIVPQKGYFYEDYTEDKFIKYREMAEYGTYILEFNSGNLGLLNKAVPHILFKRFAQSCWSELCEIYGIPPRVMKTDTQDPVMLSRAEKMMSDMGAAAWFIIDDTEHFDFAKGTDTKGDVYDNLITLSNNEISMLISGAIIGQDTKNGSRSKDQSSQEMLWNLILSDMAMVEEYWNKTIIPALVKLGVLKGDVRFEFDPAEDINQLWNRTKDALVYYNVNPEWVKEKFGIEITGERQLLSNESQSKQAANFFD